MNRTLNCLLPLFLSFLPFVAGAAEHGYSGDVSLWHCSTNSAGLAYRHMPTANVVNFLYDGRSGDFHRAQEGSSFSGIAFDTEGSLGVGKTRLWGHFRYDRINEQGTAFNTILFDPFDERQVFSVADPNVSDWNRQVYSMEFKAAAPLGKRLFSGVHVVYSDRLSAKQVDPRSESYRYDLSVVPSLVWNVGGSHAVGLSLEYSRFFERSVPVLSNVSEIQDVYVLRGLGNFVKNIVGSGGLSTIYYHTNTYGAALQYFTDRPGFGLLAEGGMRRHSTTTRESATQPFNMGSTQMTEIFSNVRVSLPHRAVLSASFLYRNTDATEYTSVWNMSTGEWEVRTSALGSRYGTLKADVSYDRFCGRWLFGGKAEWISKDDRYMLPESSFNYSNLAVSLKAGRLFESGRTTWEARADALYNRNLGGGYSYTGLQAKDAPAAVWYPADISVLTSDYLSAGVTLSFTTPMGGRLKGTSLRPSLYAGSTFAADNRNRSVFGAGISLLF